VGRTPTGATVLKRRQLRAAGWPLLPVPFWEWSALKTEAQRHEYLSRGLAEAVSAAPSGTGATEAGAAPERPAGEPAELTGEPALSWHDFQRSLKGRGLPQDEVRCLYREQRRQGG